MSNPLFWLVYCLGSFDLRLGVIAFNRLCSVIVALFKHLLYYFVDIIVIENVWRTNKIKIGKKIT